MITSTREGVHDKYWHEGFGYTFRRACKNWDTYYCQYRDKKKCMVSARYHRELGTFEVSGTHQDDPEPAAMEACLLIRRIYEMAAELQMMDPRKIVETCFGDASPEALRLTPDKEHIYRAIRKIKHEKGFDVEEPKSLTNINIGKLELLETIDGEKMFFADTGVIEGTRSLIFTTPSLLEVLAQAKGIACDATCDSSVQHFSQHYVIHAFIKEHVAVPVVFCQMSSKTERAYIEVLSRLPDCPQLTFFLSGFEQAEINALTWNFPNAQHLGCNEHFAKQLVEHLRQVGYTKKEYKANPLFRASFRRILSLPFALPQHVLDIYGEFKDYIVRIMPLDRRHEAFFVYMERTWIGSKDDNGNFRFPIFQYNHWIVHDGTRYSPYRTANVAEGWNKRFNKSTGKKPTLLRFSESLHSEIAMICQTVAEIDRTPQPLPSDKDIRLAQLLNQYGYLSTVEYFDRIGEIFSEIDF